MDTIEIQSSLKVKGITQNKIAQSLGVTPPAVSLVIRKRSISRRIMQAVAEAIDKDVRYVFVEYFYNKAA